MNMRMCLNWKVVAGLAAVGVGLVVLAPGVGARVLPLLLLAACPLSMLVMMAGMGRGMKGMGASCATQQEAPAVTGTRDQQVRALRAELANIQRRQEAVERALAQVEAEPDLWRADVGGKRGEALVGRDG